MSEPFVACLPAGHVALQSLDAETPLDLRTLLSGPLVLFSRGASPDYYERVLLLCQQLGWQAPVRHEVRHWLSVVALVSKGMGCALVPQALSRSGVAGVVFQALPESDIRSEVTLVWNERNRPAILTALLAHLTQGLPD